VRDSFVLIEIRLVIQAARLESDTLRWMLDLEPPFISHGRERHLSLPHSSDRGCQSIYRRHLQRLLRTCHRQESALLGLLRSGHLVPESGPGWEIR
jgi:hypothetical protein